MSRTSSQSGTERNRRSTRAVPKKPVEPVMAMRFPARSSAITKTCLPYGREMREFWVDRRLGEARRCDDVTVAAATDLPLSTRERILAAALVAFAERGVEATSLDAVAAEIGIRKQTILYWFPSKDQLLQGVIDHA